MKKIGTILLMLLICFQLHADDIFIKITKKYLNLPVSSSEERAKMFFEIEGKQVRELVIALAPSKPDYWVFTDVSEFKGRTIKIHYTGIQKGLKQIYQDDKIYEQDSIYKELYRPQYHFTSRRGWLNDPCGLIYHKGEYHMFYQHEPYDRLGFGELWNVHWGHAVSKDLIHWVELSDAIYPDKFGSAMASGSTVIDYNNTAGFNKDNMPAMVALFPATSKDSSLACLAYSLNNGKTFQKYEGNPIMRNTVWKHDLTRVFWHNPSNKWILLMMQNDGFSILSSINLKNWKKESHLTGFYECPQMFELPVDGNQNETKWIMHGASGNYIIGEFDGKQFIPETGKFYYCAGSFYAAQIFENIPAKDGRCIQIAWGRIDQPESMPFNQMMLLPTELSLRTTRNGIRLFSEPIKEIEKLHKEEFSWNNLLVSEANKILRQFTETDCFRLKVTMKLGHPIGAGLKLNNQDVLNYYMGGNKINGVFYSPEDPTSMKITADIFFDRTSIEVFIDRGALSYSMQREISEMSDIKFWSNDYRGNDKGEDSPTVIETLKIFPLKSIW